MRLKKKKRWGLTYATVTLVIIALPSGCRCRCRRVGGGGTPAAVVALPSVMVPGMGVTAAEGGEDE